MLLESNETAHVELLQRATKQELNKCGWLLFSILCFTLSFYLSLLFLNDLSSVSFCLHFGSSGLWLPLGLFYFACVHVKMHWSWGGEGTLCCQQQKAWWEIPRVTYSRDVKQQWSLCPHALAGMEMRRVHYSLAWPGKGREGSLRKDWGGNKYSGLTTYQLRTLPLN